MLGSSFYNSLGEAVEIPKTAVYTTSIYGELGLFWGLNLIANIPIFIHTSQEGEDSTNTRRLGGAGDITLGLEYGIIRNSPFVLSVSVLLGLPTGEDEVSADKLLQTGDGEFNQKFLLEAGFSFFPFPAYVSGGVSFNNRTEDFSDEGGFRLEGGVDFLRIFFAKVEFTSVFSLDNGDKVHPSNLYSLYLNNTQYNAFGGSVGVYLLPGRLGISLGADGAFSGTNILATPSYYGSVFFRL